MLLLVGGYTQDIDPDTPGRARGISAYDFVAGSGELQFRGYVPELNPSYLATDPERKIVYCVREATAGGGAAVAAYALRRERNRRITFEPRGEQPVRGDAPCHLTLADRTLAVCCYSSGSLHFYPLDGDGRIGPATQECHLSQGSAANECRESGPRAHALAYDRRRGRYYVCDLGCDTLRVFERRADGSPHARPEWNLPLPPGGGGGPRHILLHPGGDLAFVNCEYHGKAHLLDLSGPEGPRLLHTGNYLPERVLDQAHGAAIRSDAAGKNVYVSDRSFHVITTLRLDRGGPSLNFRDTTPSGGEHPRDFVLSPDGRWLLAANFLSDSISVFATSAKGTLKLLRTNTAIPSPTTLSWLRI